MADDPQKVEDAKFRKDIIVYGIIGFPIFCLLCHLVFKMPLELRDLIVYVGGLFSANILRDAYINGGGP